MKRKLNVLFVLTVLFMFSAFPTVSADSNETGSQTVRAKFVLDIEDFIDDEDVSVIEEDDKHYLIIEDDEGNEIKHPISAEDAKKFKKERRKKKEEKEELKSDEGVMLEKESDGGKESDSGGLKLPQTASSFFNMIALGVAFLFVGVLLFFFLKKKDKKDEQDEQKEN